MMCYGWCLVVTEWTYICSELITTVDLIGVSAPFPQNCSVLLIETIPSGMYIDVHEFSENTPQEPQVCHIHVFSLMLFTQFA